MLAYLIRTRDRREQWFRLIYHLKWIVLVALLATVMLAVPAQTTELYRILHASDTIADQVRIFLPVVIVGTAIWLSASLVSSFSIASLNEPLPLAIRLSQWLPPALGTLPILGAAWGQWNALPPALPFDVTNGLSVVGSPWELTAAELAQDLGTSLPTGALLALIFAVVAVLAWGYLRRFLPTRLPGWRALTFVVISIGSSVAAITIWPVPVPRFLGVFGVFAVFSTLLAAFAALLTLTSIRLKLPLIPAAFAIGAVAAALDINDNHTVRTLPIKERMHPPVVGSIFADWYAARTDRDRYQEQYPVYIVAAQGGGIYAAAQTAIFLARMQDRCPTFREHLFAISGVSGGSIGAAIFSAALDTTSSHDVGVAASTGPCNRPFAEMKPGELSPGPVETRVRKIIARDHLAPLAAAAMFPDFLQAFLPFPVRAFDRALALEESFSREFAEKDPNPLEMPYSSSFSHDGTRPALIFNTTDAASGRRALVAPFRIELEEADERRPEAVSYFPLWGDRGTDLPLITAAGMSARFPWVTPAATIPENGATAKTRLVDGGYADNSGVETALELMAALDVAPILEADRPQLILIALSGGSFPARTSFGFGEAMEPVRALLSTRTTRAYFALSRAFRVRAPTHYLVDEDLPQTDLIVPNVRLVRLLNPFYDLPLGWSLSDRSLAIIAAQSGRARDCEPNLKLEQAAEFLPDADCVQALVVEELRGQTDRAVRNAVIRSWEPPSWPGASRPETLDAQAVLRCYRDRTAPISLAQSRVVAGMVEGWNRSPSLEDPRHLALVLAVTNSETANWRFAQELGSRDELEKRYGHTTNVGRRLGNTEPDDGYRYRGRGSIMITGKANYSSFSKRVGIDLEEFPDLLLSPEVSARVTFSYFFDGGRNQRLLTKYLGPDSEDYFSAQRLVTGRVPSNAERVAEDAAVFLSCLDNE